MTAAADKKFMARALELAARGRGQTSPNPMVGALVVKNGRVVSGHVSCWGGRMVSSLQWRGLKTAPTTTGGRPRRSWGNPGRAWVALRPARPAY